MDSEFAPDLITLIDDDNVKHNFEILDIVETDKGTFYALYPLYNDAQEMLEDRGEYYIMEAVEENGETDLYEVYDEALLDELAAVFEERFEAFSDDEDLPLDEADSE